MARIEFAWELGAGTGHVTTLLPIARRMQQAGHAPRFLLRDVRAGADLAEAQGIPREGAPVWVGPVSYPAPANFGEILHNFGYANPDDLHALVDAWRERLAGAGAVVANVAPAAHLAARSLGIPSFEISQGFHIPPAVFPSPPLRHWEVHSRETLEAADRRVLVAMNAVMAAHKAPPLDTIGSLFTGRAMLLTYPELDIYPERDPSDYFGIPDTGEGNALPAWPEGGAMRVFAYLYHYWQGLPRLLESLDGLALPTLVFCRGIDQALREKHATGSIRFSDAPMWVSRLLPQSQLVISHGSHQMTAQALLAGRPLLMLPTQLEQFLIMRRVVRMGAGLGIAPDVPDADYDVALAQLAQEQGFTRNAAAFAARYRSHSAPAALDTMVARILASAGAA